MLASLFAREASVLIDAELFRPYEIASHLWVGHVSFWLPSTGGKFDSEEFVVGLWFLRLSFALLVASVMSCAVVLCVCTLLPVGSRDVILDKFEFSPNIRVQASGSWHCVACFSAFWIYLVCVCLVGMAKSFLDGLKALVGKFASLAAACGAFAGIIMFFTSACAAAAWPLAIVSPMMFGYVSFAAAGIAAFLVLSHVFICFSAVAARLSALVGVFVQFGCFGACSAKVKYVSLLFGVLPGVASGYSPAPSICEWDASCQSFPGLGFPTLGFLFSAAAALLVIAMVIMLWKCCSLCSGSCKVWKKESLSKLVEGIRFSSLSLQVVSRFTAVVMESCSGVWADLLRNVVAYLPVPGESMCGAGSVMDQCRQTSLCFLLAMSVIISSLGFTLLCGHVLGLRQLQCAAAGTGAFVGLLALVGVLSYAFEGLNRHVLAGSLFSGTGEQASGRVDVPGKDKQQQAAAAKDFICFFVRSLGGKSYVVKMEHRATVAQVKQHVALKSGVSEEAFYLVWEGRVLRDDDVLGCLGVVQDTQLHMCSYLRGGAGVGRQPQIPGQWVCQSCGMGGCWPTRQSCYRCGAPRMGVNVGQRPQRESHYPGQPSNQGLPINPTKRVLRGFKGGNGQPAPHVLPTGPVPASNQGLADPAMLLPRLQSLGLPDEVLEAVRAKVATQKAPRGKNSFR